MPHPRERITLLLATDLLSEGVNLQDAAVVVHLDLPWNPARLAQRLGRIRRPGGASEVTSYLMAPPARSSLLLRAEVRLRAKLARAERTIGRGLDVLPALSADAAHATAASAAPASGAAESFLAVAELRGEIHRMLTRWRQESRSVIPSERSQRTVIPSERSESRDLHPDEPVIAAARSSVRGWIAVLDDGRLITSLGDDQRTTERDDSATDDVVPLLHARRHADGVARATNDVESIVARRHVEQWITHDGARRACAIAAHGSPLRQRMLRRMASALRSVPRHQRRAALSLAASLRSALERRLTLGVERALDELPDARDGSPWLARAAALLSAPSDSSAPAQDAARATRARAIILFGPE